MSKSPTETLATAVTAGMGGPPARRWVLASLSLCMLLSALGTSIANVGLPALTTAFEASFQQVQWVVLSYLLAVTTLIVGLGRLGDILGRRRLLLAGIGLFTGATILCSVAPSLSALIAARALQGLGAAAMMALSMALVAETVPKASAGRAMGLLGTMSAVGTALGPSLGGLLLAGLGWRAMFAVSVPLAILAFFLARRSLPADAAYASGYRASGSTGFDARGTLLLAATLGSYALAMTWGRGHFGALNLALLAAAAVGMWLFIRVQKQAAAPLVRLAMLRDPRLAAGLATSALVSTVVMATLVVGPFYLARGLGLDAFSVGLVVSVGPVVVALAGMPAGRLVDRLGAGRTVGAGLLAMVAGCGLLATLPASLGAVGYVAPLVVLTTGYALFQTANNTAVMADLPPDRRGLVSGMLNLARNLGLVTGASVMGAVFLRASATTDIATAAPRAVASGMQATFGVAAALLVGALAVAAQAWLRTARDTTTATDFRAG